MDWIEIISLRSAIPASIPEPIHSEPGLENVTVYRRADLETDLSIHLSWHGRGPAVFSAQGRLVAETLREFGLVNHHIWIKEEGK